MKLKNLFALSIAAMLVLVGCKNSASGNSSTNTTSEEPTTSTTDTSTSDTSTTDSSSGSSSEDGGDTQELNAAEKAALISTLNTFESITVTNVSIVEGGIRAIRPRDPATSFSFDDWELRETYTDSYCLDTTVMKLDGNKSLYDFSEKVCTTLHMMDYYNAAIALDYTGDYSQFLAAFVTYMQEEGPFEYEMSGNDLLAEYDDYGYQTYYVFNPTIEQTYSWYVQDDYQGEVRYLPMDQGSTADDIREFASYAALALNEGQFNAALPGYVYNIADPDFFTGFRVKLDGNKQIASIIADWYDVDVDERGFYEYVVSGLNSTTISGADVADPFCEDGMHPFVYNECIDHDNVHGHRRRCQDCGAYVSEIEEHHQGPVGYENYCSACDTFVDCDDDDSSNSFLYTSSHGYVAKIYELSDTVKACSESNYGFPRMSSVGTFEGATYRTGYSWTYSGTNRYVFKEVRGESTNSGCLTLTPITLTKYSVTTTASNSVNGQTLANWVASNPESEMTVSFTLINWNHPFDTYGEFIDSCHHYEVTSCDECGYYEHRLAYDHNMGAITWIHRGSASYDSRVEEGFKKYYNDEVSYDTYGVHTCSVCGEVEYVYLNYVYGAPTTHALLDEELNSLWTLNKDFEAPFDAITSSVVCEDHILGSDNICVICNSIPYYIVYNNVTFEVMLSNYPYDPSNSCVIGHVGIYTTSQYICGSASFHLLDDGVTYETGTFAGTGYKFVAVKHFNSVTGDFDGYMFHIEKAGIANSDTYFLQYVAPTSND